MKKVFVSTMLMVLVSAFIISCGLIEVDEYERFNLNEETIAKIGERLFLDDEVFVYLDKIVEDTRAPLTIVTDQAQYVALEFTVGAVDTNGRVRWSQQLEFQTDTLDSRAFMVPFVLVSGGRQYILTVVDVDPWPTTLDQRIPNKDYEVTFVLESGVVAFKPNIYIYPTKKIKLDVSLGFPQGGEVIKSIPDFPNEWKNIKVKPSGLINNEFGYLFYEAALPDRWQFDKGWSVMINDLESFFRTNLARYGFIENEINDFINYWIPKLQDHPYYNIYPQYTDKVDEVVTLNISKEPESLMRLFYVIKGSMEMKSTEMDEPVIPQFNREGFTVTEWGVIL